MGPNVFIKKVKEANNSFQEANKSELVKFPMTNIKNPYALEKLKALNANMLKTVFKRGQLTRKELLLVFRYKLSDRVGLVPYMLANKGEETRRLLTKEAAYIFANKSRGIKTCEQIFQCFNKVVQAINGARRLTFSDLLKSESVEYNVTLESTFQELQESWDKVKSSAEEFVSDNAGLGHKKRSEWFLKTCELFNIEKETDNWQLANEIYAEEFGNDPTNVTYVQLNKYIIPGLGDAIRDQSHEREHAFYTVKLFKPNLNLDLQKFPRGTGVMCIFYDLKNLVDTKKALENVDTEFYMSHNTRDNVTKKIGKLVNKGGDNSGAVSAEASDIEVDKEALKRRASLPTKSKAPDVSANRARSRSVGSEDNEGPDSDEGSDKRWIIGKVKKKNLALRNKFRDLLSSARMKLYVSRLAKIGNDERRKQEIEKLVENYSTNDEEKEEYRNVLIKRVRFNEFVDAERPTLEKCFNAVKKYKKYKTKKHGSADLDGDTAHFCKQVYSAKNFNEFAAIVFNMYYVDEENWLRRGSDLKPILLLHCFNIETEFLPETEISGRNDVFISGTVPTVSGEGLLKIGNNISTKVDTIKVTIPSNYLDLRRETMRRIHEIFKYTDQVLWPNMQALIGQLKSYLSQEDYKEQVEGNIGIIKQSILCNPVQRVNITGEWEALFNGDTTLYESYYYPQILKNGLEKDKPIEISEASGDLRSLLKFIWLIYVDYEQNNFEERYKAWNDYFTALTEPFKGHPGDGSGMTLDDDDDEATVKPPPSELPKEAFEAMGMKPPSGGASQGNS